MKRTKKHKQTKAFKARLSKNLERNKHRLGVHPTDFQATRWFNILNEGIFNNKLPATPIYVRRLANDWGRCVANWDNRKTPKGRFDQRVIPYHIPVEFYIELHCKFPKWRDFIETLAHEMVHLYQMTIMKDPYSNHNSNFYSFRNKFRSFGLKLYR